MGCSTSGSIIHPQQMQETLYGVLRIQLVGGLLECDLNSPNSQVTIICKMSNQEFRSKILTKASFININEVYEFMVNSRYQKYGRSLQVQLIESGLFSQNTVGVGFADLQLIIRERKRENFKIYLTREKSRVGWIQLQVLFQQFPTFPVTLLFDSVLVRRKPTSLGDLQCRIRTTIGEQVLVSNFCIDKQDQPPSWKNEKFTFHILKGIIRQGKIQVLHTDKQIGTLSLNIEQIEQSSESQIEVSQQFYYGDNIIAGTIKFFINKGDDINSVSLQMKKSAFISPLKKKLPPLNANFKSNEMFTNQLSKHVPKDTVEDKLVMQNQLQNELHHSQDSDNQVVKIEHKFHQNQRNTNLIIIKQDKKEANIHQIDMERKQQESEKTRQIKQEAVQTKLSQQQNRLKIVEQQKQHQLRQQQLRTSILKRKVKQQQDQKIRQQQERKIQQLEKIKLKQEENAKIKMQQQQDRIKLLEQERAIKKFKEQSARQEQNRKTLQDNQKNSAKPANKLIQQEEIKKKIEQQTYEKIKIEQQLQNYRNIQQQRLMQQKRKAEQLKKSKEQQQDRLKKVKLPIIPTKEQLQLLEKQSEKKQQKQQISNKRQNDKQQLQKTQLQQGKVEETIIFEQTQIKKIVQKSQQIIKQSYLREEQTFKQNLEISQSKPNNKIEDIQTTHTVINKPQNQIQNVKGSQKQQDNQASRQESKNLLIVTNTLEIKPITKDKQHQSIAIDKFEPVQLIGSQSDLNSNHITTPIINEQTILPNQRQHSRLLLESAFLENGSDDQSDK